MADFALYATVLLYHVLRKVTAVLEPFPALFATFSELCSIMNSFHVL